MNPLTVWQVIAYVLRETLEAIKHLHVNNIVHRDIKGQNILITDKGAIKLGQSEPSTLSMIRYAGLLFPLRLRL